MLQVLEASTATTYMARSRGSRNSSRVGTLRSVVFGLGGPLGGYGSRLRSNTTSGSAAMIANIRKVSVYPALSMANPAATGPRVPAADCPSERMLKLLTRSRGVPYWPARRCCAMKIRLCDVPIMTLTTKSAASSCHTHASPAPSAIITEPTSIGMRQPERSIHRPICTDVKTLTRLNRAESNPTVAADAERCTA